MRLHSAIPSIAAYNQTCSYTFLLLGGGLVIGLSAGLLAPVIGAGIGAALTTVGISGTAGFLGGTAGAAVITTGGVLTGSGIAARGMSRRTQYVRTFDILPLHNNKRVNCIITVPGCVLKSLCYFLKVLLIAASS